MGLMTLGLLGVAAIFPVGGFYMQAGDISDRGGAIAQAALEDAIIQGHLNPANWVTIDVSAIATTTFNSMALLEKSLPAKILTPAGAAISGGSMPVYRNRVAGGAFVIDPIGMSRALEEATTNSWRVLAGTGVDSRVARRFPASRGINYRSESWSPWTAGAINGSDLNQQLWPVRRIITTVPSAAVAIAQYNRLAPAATHAFSGSEDIALTLPDNGDEPAQGLWEQLPGGLAGVRQARGEYSWIISVSPSSFPARESLVATPDAHPYEVSAVVFHKRVVGAGNDAALANERLVRASVVSSTPNGGELLLERRPTAEDPASTSPFENLRVGQYVMLTGPHPLSTMAQPQLVLSWYRVLSVEKEGRPNLNGVEVPLGIDTRTNPPREKVLVSLRGADWPWQPAATGLDDPSSTLLSNDLRVGILPGVVAVHTKTMRLESATEWAIR